MAETVTTFAYAAATQSYVVPDNVFVVRVVASGGQGNGGPTGSAGAGGRSTCLVPVTPGETLTVAVGRSGVATGTAGVPTPNGDTLGRGGGGTYPGGASSHVRRGAVRLVVGAGGGSGGSDPSTGGVGGGSVGGNAVGFGFPGLGGGSDPTYAVSDGEGADGSGGGGGGGVIGGRAGRYGTGSGKYGAGGGGSGRVTAGGTMESGVQSLDGSVSITAGVAPYAPTLLYPVAGQAVPTSAIINGAASFNGASPKDTLSARQFRIDGTFVYSGGSDGAPIPTAALSAGSHTIEARDANQHGTSGPWSAPATFTVADAPAAPTINTPTPGSTITTATATLTWAGVGQAGYRVRRLSDDYGSLGAVVYYDSGVVTSLDTSVALAFPVDARTEWVQVALIGTNGLQGPYASARYPVQRTRPAVPTAVATAVQSTTGYRLRTQHTDAIDVAIVNPTESGRAAASYNDVFAGPPGGPLAKVNPKPVPPNSTFRWSLPAGLVDYVVLVRAVAASGAVASGFADGSPAEGYGLGPYGTTPYGL